MTRIVNYDQAIRDGRFSPADAEAYYAALLVGYETLEYFERNLLRHLHHEAGLSFRQVAERLRSPNLTTRQAVHARWKRLKADDRRVVGSPARGGPQGLRRMQAEAAARAALEADRRSS